MLILERGIAGVALKKSPFPPKVSSLNAGFVGKRWVAELGYLQMNQ
jgi:hypothetical protein